MSSTPQKYQRRPSSIAELAQKARSQALRENQNLKYYLKHAESNRREGIRLAEAGDIEAAFIAFARTASLVLEALPAHPDYKTALDDNQRLNLNLNGQEILDNLGQLKAKISDRYEAYRKDHPEIEESHQRALQAQNAYEEAQQFQPGDGLTDRALQEAQERAAKLSEEIAKLSVHDPQYPARSLPMPTPGLVSALSSARQAAYVPGHSGPVSPTSPHGRGDARRAQDAVQSARAAAATAAPAYVPMPSVPAISPYSVEYGLRHPNAYTIPTGTPLKAYQNRERPPSFVGPQAMPLESPSKYEGDSTDSEASYPTHSHGHGHGHHSRSHSATPSRSSSFPPPVTTSTFSNQVQYPQIMSQHQKSQGYVTSDHPALVSPTRTTPPSMPHPTIHYPNLHPPTSSSSSSHRAPSPSAPPRPPPPSTRPTSPDRAYRASSRDSGGLPGLKTVILPRDSLSRFLIIASVNTSRNKETCGLLLGREVRGRYVVSTLLIPKQHSTSDTCTMDEEELVMQFTEERNLITLGWIHTHPTQSCFMSSVDLHTHCAFQLMLPESFAVVCAPKSNPNFGIFRLTDPPGLGLITNCKAKEAFHPHPDKPIYTDADKGHVQMRDVALEIVDLRD
ncbi:hypothetical protein V5O48_012213 [Marasmius crinis-equi]|uniref:MPN domain-containing protein n=1 Tax=Marasmius crinis-equi TaxID=585013 RepID=A0ABR3F3F9_9AGAR